MEGGERGERGGSELSERWGRQQERGERENSV